ncbi:MAG: hypothetical protein ABWZ88_15270 [Variovorax sp.]
MPALQTCSFNSQTESFVWAGICLYALIAGVLSASPLRKAIDRLLRSAPLTDWLSAFALQAGFLAAIYAGLLGITGCGTAWEGAFLAAFVFVAFGASALLKCWGHRYSDIDEAATDRQV